VIVASGQARLSDVTIGMPCTTSPIALSSTMAIERGACGMADLPLVNGMEPYARLAVHYDEARIEQGNRF
jgi:hypothetical protein